MTMSEERKYLVRTRSEKMQCGNKKKEPEPRGERSSSPEKDPKSERAKARPIRPSKVLLCDRAAEGVTGSEPTRKLPRSKRFSAALAEESKPLSCQDRFWPRRLGSPILLSLGSTFLSRSSRPTPLTPSLLASA